MATVNVLVVGGGAGGGSSVGGGGGGGAVINNPLFTLAPNTYSVTIGTGGAGGAAGAHNYGVNGNATIFSSITAVGGGGGASVLSRPTTHEKSPRHQIQD